jgi:hypothetical protein
MVLPAVREQRIAIFHTIIANSKIRVKCFLRVKKERWFDNETGSKVLFKKELTSLRKTFVARGSSWTIYQKIEYNRRKFLVYSGNRLRPESVILT